MGIRRVSNVAPIEQTCRDAGITETFLRSGSRSMNLPAIRKQIADKFVIEYGLSLAETARQPGVTASAASYMLKQRRGSVDEYIFVLKAYRWIWKVVHPDSAACFPDTLRCGITARSAAHLRCRLRSWAVGRGGGHPRHGRQEGYPWHTGRADRHLCRLPTVG